MTAWMHDRYVAVVDASARRLLDVAEAAGPESPVPSCPGWTIDDLVAHIGSVHRWATQIVLTGRPADSPEVPDGWQSRLTWARAGAATLVDVLRSVDPQQPSWTFGPEPHLAGFWGRRQAQETTMHLWDAVAARGSHHRWDADLAVDGIDEVATVFYPRQVRLGRTPDLPGRVQLDVTDAPGAGLWLDPVEAADEAAPEATLRGTAEELLLALWGRRAWESVDVSGDATVIDALRGAAITP